MPACAYCGTTLEPGSLTAISARPLVAVWGTGPEFREGLHTKIAWTGTVEFPGFRCPACRTILLYYASSADRATRAPDG